MASVTYPAIVERTGNGFSIYFPDLPGCTSAGSTLQEVASNAEEALGGHLLVLAEHGEDAPAPTELDPSNIDPEVQPFAFFLVRADKPGRSIRLNISMDEGLVAAIDRAAPNRSAFLAEAARIELARRRELEHA